MRKIYIIGPITDDTFVNVSIKIDEFTQESTTEPIHIEICSEGGSAHAGLAIYGKIRTCAAPVHCKIYGACQSAATLIVCACDLREASPEVVFMVHDSEHKLKGEANHLLNSVKDIINDEKHWTGLLTLRTKLGFKEWRKLHRNTTYFTSQTALEYGLIDSILEEK